MQARVGPCSWRFPESMQIFRKGKACKFSVPLSRNTKYPTPARPKDGILLPSEFCLSTILL